MQENTSQSLCQSLSGFVRLDSSHEVVPILARFRDNEARRGGVGNILTNANTERDASGGAQRAPPRRLAEHVVENERVVPTC